MLLMSFRHSDKSSVRFTRFQGQVDSDRRRRGWAQEWNLGGLHTRVAQMTAEAEKLSSYRYDQKSFTAVLLMPTHCCQRETMISWSTVSKAAVRSKSTRIA